MFFELWRCVLMVLSSIFTKSALWPLWSSSRDVCPHVCCPLPIRFSQGSKGGPRGAKQSPIVASIPWKNVSSLRLQLYVDLSEWRSVVLVDCLFDWCCVKCCYVGASHGPPVEARYVLSDHIYITYIYRDSRTLIPLSDPETCEETGFCFVHPDFAPDSTTVLYST